MGLGGFASIKRVNRNRAVNATASIDPAISAAVGVIEDLRTRMHPAVLAGHPAVFRTFENAQSKKVDAGGRQLGFVLALLMNFAPARGAVAAYVQALIIMCSFPSDSSIESLASGRLAQSWAQRTSCRRQQVRRRPVYVSRLGYALGVPASERGRVWI